MSFIYVKKLLDMWRNMKMWPIIKKRKTTKIDPKITQILELIDKSFKAATLTIFEDLLENTVIWTNVESEWKKKNQIGEKQMEI